MVGAVIVRDGMVLAARRLRPVELAGKWEFPGGKVEDGEDLTATLVREIDEELNSRISVIEEIADEGSPWRISDKHALRLFLATVGPEAPLLSVDHDEVRWLPPDRLSEVDWLTSDRLALSAVRRAVERFQPPTSGMECGSVDSDSKA
ncbi:(deoxy)nucleoside triphosphate pyrophosphohydrolase [Microbacterium awajiense]|uniref:8-oxo-dGTP diphosphatase n=1 Tax=Microbacterium awajiense TaxID=415214 RepID=A0ABP7AH41_9MICO